MEVYLVPVGRGRYALYCEPGEDAHHDHVDPSAARGPWKKLSDRFSAVIDAVEREQDERAHAQSEAPRPSGLWARLRARVMAWMAEKIAEQRLLWRLRGKAQVQAWVPAGLDRDHATATIRGNLTAEFDRHRWWMVVDSLGGVFSLALMPVPGPNVIGYYFAFRIVGHFLSLRGARHGLTGVRWDIEPSPSLAELVGIEELPAHDREHRVEAVAGQLGLHRLPRFYRRAAVETA